MYSTHNYHSSRACVPGTPSRAAMYDTAVCETHRYEHKRTSIPWHVAWPPHGHAHTLGSGWNRPCAPGCCRWPGLAHNERRNGPASPNVEMLGCCRSIPPNGPKVLPWAHSEHLPRALLHMCALPTRHAPASKASVSATCSPHAACRACVVLHTRRGANLPPPRAIIRCEPRRSQRAAYGRLPCTACGELCPARRDHVLRHRALAAACAHLTPVARAVNALRQGGHPAACGSSRRAASNTRTSTRGK